MAKYTSLVPGVEIDNAWEYVPLSAVVSADGSHRNVTAGHCVTVTERKPAVALITDAGSFTLNLDKADSVQKILDAIGK